MNENNDLNNNVTPVEPVQPTEPVTPTEPVAPAAPVAPTAPEATQPVEPTPVVESAPAAPVAPVEPTAPATPAVTQPIAPTTTETTGTTTEDGLQENDKLYGVLSYLGVLSLIVLYVIKPKTEYALFHAKQGSNLFIIQLIINIFGGLVTYVLRLAHVPFAGTLVSLVSTAVWVLSLIGLIWAIQGLKKELPIINKIKIIK